MDYIVSILVSVISAMLVFILQFVVRENIRLKRAADEAQASRSTALKDGMVCLLRRNLMEEHEKWTKKGYITSNALENDLLMYKAYKTLGGNGMIEHMNVEIQDLPIKGN